MRQIAIDDVWSALRLRPGLTMITADQARQLALGLPETVEQDHHGRPSFRVCKRIFATLWDRST